jgi:integrase/recombinase XerD
MLKDLSSQEEKLIAYRSYLKNVRGLESATIQHHFATGLKFFSWLDKFGGLSYLQKLTSQNIENFVSVEGKKVGRAQLRHIIAFLRSFLNFLAARDEAPKGLSDQIDTPRIYREEQLPRSLDWEIVRTLLQSIDRSNAIGKRDYAMLLLIATYGLRACEIVTLKLDDLDWRHNCLRITQRKTGVPLVLPLTSEVGKSIISYLHQGRPPVPYREIFLHHAAPHSILKASCISSIFRAWSRRSCLSIPYSGAHCLRHSYAVHLLRQGIALKTISDILGHRSLESTCIYLRLAVEDLRTVPLSLPILSPSKKGGIS